jgi:RNA polymerase sigma-70 factor (ECF subfamily)
MQSHSDKSTFTKYIEDNKGIIFKISNAYCANKNDVDDLSQEIVFNLWKAFGSYDPAQKFSTWMYRVALNVAISVYRKTKKAKPFLPLSDHIHVFELDHDRFNTDENHQLLFSFINKLKPIDKSIILLYLDERTYREIAEITGITETNVATRLSRIKDSLKSNFLTAKHNFYGH